MTKAIPVEITVGELLNGIRNLPNGDFAAFIGGCIKCAFSNYNPHDFVPADDSDEEVKRVFGNICDVMAKTFSAYLTVKTNEFMGGRKS